jgi:predicted Zn-ribbon and HTH transcriptional regulator
VSNIDRLMLTMNANGFERSQYRLWSAHYGAGEHICGPATCKQCGYRVRLDPVHQHGA